jgi:hypothetical protein
MDPADLDRLLDRELRALPQPRAPQSLAPRVMAAAAARQTARGSARVTGWSTWPRIWQAAAATFAVACGVAGGWLLLSPPAGLAEAAQTAGEGLAVMRIFWDALLQPASAYLLVIGVTFALACAAVWAALEAALGGASSR